MASSMLRPLSLGEILDLGIKVVTRNWKPLLVTLLIVTTPIDILTVFVLASFGDSELTFQIIPDTSQTADTPGAEFWLSLAVTGLLSTLASLFAITALFKGVSDAWLGVRPTVRRSLAYGARRVPKVLLLFAVWIGPIIVFALACGFPAVWLGTVWSLSIPALLFEGVGPFRALGRSYGLIQGRFWESLLIVIVGFVLTQMIAGAVGLPLRLVVSSASDDNAIANGIASVVGSMVSAAVSYPYQAALLTILYFDQRVRKEGFDIQMLSEGSGLEHDPDAPLPLPPKAPPAYAPPVPYWQPPPPLRWGPAPGADPADARPPEESPWMTPAPPADGGSLWPRRPGPPEGDDEDERDRPDWLPPEPGRS